MILATGYDNPWEPDLIRHPFGAFWAGELSAVFLETKVEGGLAANLSDGSTTQWLRAEPQQRLLRL